MSGHAAGSLTQLVAKGALDMYLTENPTSTFWRAAYARCTAFSMESIKQDIVTTGGTSTTVTLNRTGDLLYTQYLMLEVPGIRLAKQDLAPVEPNQPPEEDAETVCPCDGDDDAYLQVCREAESEIDGVRYVHWTNAVGMAALDHATLLIGSQYVDTIFGDFLFAYEELSGRVGRRLLEMVGKRYTREELIVDSQEKRTLYVPLPWWFTQFSGAALNLAALQFHTVSIQFRWRTVADLIVGNPKFAPVKPSDCVVCTGPGGQVPLSEGSIGKNLLSTYVYLDTDERSAFSSMTADQLIIQHQRISQDGLVGGRQTIPINFNHPILELIWYARRKSATNSNNWFNFAGPYNRDPIKYASLQLNAQERFGGDQLPANYYRLVQPYQAHSCIPDTFVYCYSFALHPEDTTTPSGSANFSRIDNISFTVTLETPGTLSGNQGTDTFDVVVHAVNWNVGRLRNGLFGVAYSS